MLIKFFMVVCKLNTNTPSYVNSWTRIWIWKKTSGLHQLILLWQFDFQILPSSGRVGCLNVRVGIYMPSRMQCFDFGHHKPDYARQSLRHGCHADLGDCNLPVRCLNCDGNLYAVSALAMCGWRRGKFSVRSTRGTLHSHMFLGLP